MTKDVIVDEKLAKFVEVKLQLIGHELLQSGRYADQLNFALQRVATDMGELKEALRTGEFQLTLPSD